MRARFVVRKARMNKSGTCPVNCRITVNMIRSNEFGIGVLVDPQKWDSKAQRVKGNTPAAIEANRKLEIVRAELSEIYLSSRAKGTRLTASQLRSIYMGEAQEGCSISRLSTLYLNELRIKGRSRSTMGRYERCYKYLQDHIDDVQVSDVTRKMVSGFWLHLKEKGYNHDYCNKIVQSCIGLFRYAIREGYIDKSPFAGYSLEWKKVLDITCLEKDEIEKIVKHKWSEKMEKVADSFLFMCYTGLHIADYRDVTSGSVYEFDGHKFMKVRRIKTGVEAVFPLTEFATRLISKYNGIDNLPRISPQKMNDYLKVMAEKLDIKKNLTNKIARKTFTNMCLNDLNLSLEVVAMMLGHTSTRQIKHYGSIKERRILKEMNLI